MSTDDSQLLDLSKPVGTRDGRKVVIHTTKGRHPTHPICGEYLHCDEWLLARWKVDGTVSDNRPCERSLVNVAREHTVWINVYQDGAHSSKDKANEAATLGRMACFEHTFVEGEGLD